MAAKRTAIIMGAGVTGLSTAYHLARKGYGRILVFDKGPVGDGSSQRAAAMITGLLWNDLSVRVRKRCLELYGELSTDLEGYRFRRCGCLNLLSPAQWPERAALLPVYDRLGAPYEILNPEEVTARWPDLRPEDGIVGLFDPLGGYSEPSEYLPAMRARLLQLGVEIHEFEPVTGFQFAGDRLSGIETPQGSYEADAIVSTVYAWTRVLFRQMNFDLPIKSFVLQRYVTAPLSPELTIPAVNADPHNAYFRPALGGRLLVGIDTTDREEYRVTAPDFHQSSLRAPAGLAEQAREQLWNVLPAIRDAQWEEEKVGLINFSMDNEPILGPISGIPGLYVGVAFHSSGFAYNPGTGELLAQFVADGGTQTDVSAWSPDRFDPHEAVRFLDATYHKSDVARRRH